MCKCLYTQDDPMEQSVVTAKWTQIVLIPFWYWQGTCSETFVEPVTTTATTVCNEIPPYIAFAVVPSIQEVQVQKFTYYSGHQPFNDIHNH